MTNETGESERKRLREKEARQDRLKSALRENLKRRKMQARERGKVSRAASADDASPHGEVGKRRD